MPALSLATWLAATLAARAPASSLATGLALFALFWLVEAAAIEGRFEGAVPKHPVVMASRLLWLVALAFSVFDAERLHVSSWPGTPVRVVGAALFMAGLALRLWSMRTLRRAFSYDLKITADQTLVTSGPYRWVRHPAYTGLVILSVSCAVWNPSAIGIVALAVTTLPQVMVRIAIEERMLADHFGERWNAWASDTRRLIPFVW